MAVPHVLVDDFGDGFPTFQQFEGMLREYERVIGPRVDPLTVVGASELRTWREMPFEPDSGHVYYWVEYRGESVVGAEGSRLKFVHYADAEVLIRQSGWRGATIHPVERAH